MTALVTFASFHQRRYRSAYTMNDLVGSTATTRRLGGSQLSTPDSMKGPVGNAEIHSPEI